MFNKIMTPIDLAHLEGLQKGLKHSADLARHYGAEIVYVGVTSSAPSATAHNPEEYAQRLELFAAEEAKITGVKTSAYPVICHDPTTELDDALLKAVKETGADLVVMASHLPGLIDYVWPSNGGKIAAHAACSVMVIR